MGPIFRGGRYLFSITFNLSEMVMSRKTTAALVAALGINFALAGGALMLANLNKPVGFDIDPAFASDSGDLDEVAGKAVDPEAGDLAIPLKAAQLGGNTRVTFTCGKNTGGGTREVHEGTWDQVRGAILYRPEEQSLLAVEAVFDTRSLRTDAQGLTTTVTTKEKWFDIDNHPQATFTCDDVEAINAADSSHTHRLRGSFTLNGITKPITIPAEVVFAGQSLTLDASFTVLRSDFGVDKRESSVAGTLGGVVSTVDDEVQLAVRVTASPDPVAVISELAQLVDRQQEQMRVAREERKRLEGLFRKVELLEQSVDRMASAGPVQAQLTDTAGLPKAYTDYSRGYDKAYPFKMLLLPGDPGQGIPPFYICQHEVTWGMFDRWMEAGDLDGKPAAFLAELREAGLRPTPLYGDPTVTVQLNDKDNPVIAVSQLTATAFCKWLSEQTGRKYRLPTMKEWEYALRLGGGVPKDLDAAAWHAGNSPKNLFSKKQSSPVMSKAASTIGLHDMIGSAAEWVTDTGTDRVVVGGSFATDPAELTADWQAVEDLEVWSASYPNDPKSRYWYSDFYYTGIRLICEPASVAANPPEDQ